MTATPSLLPSPFCSVGLLSCGGGRRGGGSAGTASGLEGNCSSDGGLGAVSCFLYNDCGPRTLSTMLLSAESPPSSTEARPLDWLWTRVSATVGFWLPPGVRGGSRGFFSAGTFTLGRSWRRSVGGVEVISLSWWLTPLEFDPSWGGEGLGVGRSGGGRLVAEGLLFVADGGGGELQPLSPFFCSALSMTCLMRVNFGLALPLGGAGAWSLPSVG